MTYERRCRCHLTDCPWNLVFRGSAGEVPGQPNRTAVTRSLLSERGAVTLPELLVSLPLVVLIVVAVLGLANLSQRDHDRTDSRVRSLSQQQAGMERIQRELRQATSITPVSSQIVEMNTYVAPANGSAAVARRVRYDCTGGSCKRYEGTVGGTTFSSGPIVSIANVLNADIFVMEPDYVNPYFVALSVDVSVRGASNPIALRGGVTLRNQARDS